jgi:3-methyl-2-oxobutanoate hydroxymethyltransferase
MDEHVDLILVGDSLGMVVHGSRTAMVVVDLPFGAYEAGKEQAFAAASRVMMETGCQAIKIESGTYAAETIEYLVTRGIPVMSHVGLRPQSMHVLGGFKARGRTNKIADEILANAKAAAKAGSFAVVVEGVSEELADKVTAAVDIPTIGIGASAQCDGQILVTPDMLGQFARVPKFVKKYSNQLEATRDAVAQYASDVKDRSFPGDDNLYHFKKATS